MRALPLWAQVPAIVMRRVGVLAPSTQAKEEVTLKPFFDEMHRLGWIEGRTIVYDRVYANDRHQDLPKLAAEMVARKPELIYAPPQVAAIAAKQATQTIPIVFGTGANPVRSGLVTSLARPGGNVTGTTIQSIDSFAPKRVEILREILPGVRRLGLVGDPADPRFAGDRDALLPVASALDLTVVLGEVSNEAELDAAVGKLIASRVEVILAATTISSNLRDRIIALANAKRVPVIGGDPLAESGALFTFGSSVSGQLRRSAQLVDKVLNGTKPADIPVEQPTMFELVINLRAAKALGIVVPQSLVNRADRVIQ